MNQKQGNRIQKPALMCVFMFVFALSAAPARAVGMFANSGQVFGTALNTYFTPTGDIDSDGDIDFIESNRDGHANQVWFNNGDGTAFVAGAALGNQSTRTMDFADVDGDGDLDIIDSNDAGAGNMADKVWLNDGAGVFTDSGQSLGSDNTAGGAVADVDGDGDMDYIAGITSAGNKVWLNNGSGIFSDSGQSLGNAGTVAINAGDLDGDGDIDFVDASWGQASKVYLNNGAGTFTDSGQSVGTTNTGNEKLFDMDGDGDLDLVSVAGTGEATTIWSNNGAGVFTDTGQTLSAALHTMGVNTADLDGDGDIDLLLANEGAANTVWLNNGAGTFTDLGELYDAGLSRSIAATDLDGDGDIDCISANNNVQADTVWINNTNHANAAPTAPALTAEPDAGFTGSTTPVTLQWTAGTDAQTTDADLLTYDVRIGTTSGGCEVFCGSFPKSATAMPTGPGNAGHALSITKNLGPGTFYWAVRTADTTFKRSAWSAEDSFMLDNTAPAAGTVTPAATDYNGTHVDATFDLSTPFTDAVPGVASCEYCKATDGTCDTEWAAGNWAAGTCSISGLTCTDAQSITLNMRATDSFGNVGTSTSVTRTCDTTGPAAGAVTPANSDYNAQSVDAAFDLSATFTDTGSGVASCEYCKATDGTCDTEWAAGNWAAGSCSATNVSCTDGQALILNMRATDNLGNVGAGAQVARTCDTTGPLAAFNTPAAASLQTTAFAINITDTDAGSGLASCQYKVESNTGVAWVETKVWTARTCNSATSATITVLSTGDCRNNGTDACRVTLRATDNLGNAGAEAARTFTISGVAASTVCGDVDGDGGVYSNDLLLAARAADGTLVLTDDQKSRADVVLRGAGAADGTMDTSDRDLIARVLVADGALTSAGLSCTANP